MSGCSLLWSTARWRSWRRCFPKRAPALRSWTVKENQREYSSNGENLTQVGSGGAVEMRRSDGGVGSVLGVGWLVLQEGSRLLAPFKTDRINLQI